MLQPTSHEQRFYGVYPALVTEITDPDGQGRVKVKLPWAPDPSGGTYEVWARIATMFAGPTQGSWFIPDVDHEVLVCFEGGNPRHPYVIGALWNGQDSPPASMDGAGKNEIKRLQSRNGLVITMTDKDGQESIEIETPGGQSITIKDGPGEIELKDAAGNSIKLESAGITIMSSAKVTVQASTVDVSAGSVSVNAGMSTFSGVVQCSTLITNSVVSASYTPGAGNIW